MATIATPQASRKRTDESQSPSLKADGISTRQKHLPREAAVQELYNTAKKRQHVVIGSPAATGKSSLIQLLGKKLKGEEGAKVVRINMNSTSTSLSLLNVLKSKGVDHEYLSKLRQLKQTNKLEIIILLAAAINPHSDSGTDSTRQGY
jgi:hypothetical protein